MNSVHDLATFGGAFPTIRSTADEQEWMARWIGRVGAGQAAIPELAADEAGP
jgi:hypothetical protein